ncbi:hypothetical protein HMPREF1557_00822 [Streptococcus sobrinus W1703]|uniref:Uncharacterized protein n=1 Tax=Streptococcus sobrinus W1703 TaxID=1227275 RepID=U2KHL7_9STRE|nr:hypothetical protein HMPREF1557_00822 [Streptococcus sobrinus W1703]
MKAITGIFHGFFENLITSLLGKSPKNLFQFLSNLAIIEQQRLQV